MKNKPLLFLLSVCGLLAISARGENPPAKVIFEQYMNQAQTFADNYPREKAYLHFDNTSYYVGDTIWFKAYVTLAEKQVFSSISRPLYVELVDQAGHVTDKQIIKLSQGEGNGQFVLPQSMLSGYYEVRAYRNVNDKKVYGSSSTAVKGKAILSVPALSVGSTSKTAVLEWSKVKGADGYQVYASASKNGKYIRIKATKGTGMTEEKLATGKTRYYKVRAYRKVNGKAVYGSFSKVKKVVIK